MLSVAILIVSTVMTLLVSALAIMLAARAVGSARARYLRALTAIGIMLAWSIVLSVLDLFVQRTAFSLVLLVLQLVAPFVILRQMFELSHGRTWAPFGAFIAINIFYIAVAIFVIKPILVEAFHVPSAGMAPALQPGDRFCANKLLRPRRFDVIAYWAKTGRTPTVFCQRIVGMPGDHLKFSGGSLFVNDKAAAFPPALAGKYFASPFPNARYRDGGTIRLGADEYFLLGDNLDHSFDSRYLGPAKQVDIVGVADWVYWPVGRMAILR